MFRPPTVAIFREVVVEGILHRTLQHFTITNNFSIALHGVSLLKLCSGRYMSECVRVIGKVETTGRDRSSVIGGKAVTVPLVLLHEVA
jgi:hypothetical protein